MFEIKNKQTIIEEDIQKFKNDAKQFPFSVFLSL